MIFNNFRVRVCSRSATSQALLLIIGLMLISNGHAQTRLALVMGNGKYEEQSNLKNPVNDAELIAESLRSVGFELFEKKAHVNLNRVAMLEKINGFRKWIKENQDVVAVFYFSGHGLQANNRNYLLPIDFSAKDEVEVQDNGVAIEDQVLARLNLSKPLVNILILDACRNNPFEKSIRANLGPSKALGRSKGLNIGARSGSLIWFAAEPNQVAYESKGQYSYFTRALADTLQFPGLHADTVIRKVRLIVKKETKAKQLPTQIGLLEIDFYFNILPDLLTKSESSLVSNAHTETTSMTEIFESGWKLFRDHEFQKAISVLEKFRKNYSKSRNAIEAHYLIGASYFFLENYQNAALELYDFLLKNPEHPYVSDAQWKFAQSLEKSGEIGLAIELYRVLAQSDSSYRVKAQEILNRIE